MFIKLLPDQISKHWDVIRYAIQESYPPTAEESPDKLIRILSSLLSSKMSCWVSYDRNESESFKGILITRILYDDSADTRNLSLYCMYGYSDISEKDYIEAIQAILKYAKSVNCKKLIGYSNIPQVVERAKSLGLDTSYTLLSYDIK